MRLRERGLSAASEKLVLSLLTPADLAGTSNYKDYNRGNLVGSALDALGKSDLALRYYAACVALEPTNYRAFANRAYAFKKQKRLDEALESIQTARRLHGGADHNILYTEALVFLDLKMYASAFSILQECISLNRRIPAYFLFAAEALFCSGDVIAAVDQLETACQLFPSEVTLFVMLSYLQQRVGSTTKALLTAEIASKIDPSSHIAQLEYGSALVACNRLNEAEQAYLKADSIFPGLAETAYQLGYIRTTKNETDLALSSLFKAVALAPERDEISKFLAEYLIYLKRYEECLSFCNSRAVTGQAHLNNERALCMLSLERPSEAYPILLQVAQSNGAADAYHNAAAALIRCTSKPRPPEILKIALSHTTEAIRLNPDFVAAYVLRGSIYCDLEQLVEGTSDFLKGLILSPSPDIQERLGQVYLQLGDCDSALRYFESCLHDGFVTPQLLDGYYKALMKRGRTEDALRALKSYEEHNGPITLDYLLILAGLQDQLRDHTGSLETAERAVALFPSEARALERRAIASGKVGKLTEAAADYRAALSLSGKETARIRYRIAECCWQAGDDEQAAALFRVLVEEYPNDQNARLALAQVLRDIGDYDEALYQISLYSQLPGSVEHLWKITKGELLFKKEDIPDAIVVFAELYATMPSDPEIVSWLATCYFRMSQYEDCLKIYQSIDPNLFLDDLLGRLEVGQCLIYLGRPDEAVTVLSGLVQDRPEAEIAVYWLARAFGENGEGDKAIEFLHKMISEDRADEYVHKYLKFLNKEVALETDTNYDLRRYAIATSDYQGGLENDKDVLTENDLEQIAEIMRANPWANRKDDDRRSPYEWVRDHFGRWLGRGLYAEHLTPDAKLYGTLMRRMARARKGVGAIPKWFDLPVKSPEDISVLPEDERQRRLVVRAEDARRRQSARKKKLSSSLSLS